MYSLLPSLQLQSCIFHCHRSWHKIILELVELFQAADFEVQM
jgi:hypothetical protein